MPITLKELLALSKGGAEAGASGTNPYAEGDQQRKTQAQKAQLEGEAEKSRQAQGLEMFRKLKEDNRDLLNNGGSLNYNPQTGDINAGANPYAKILGQGPHEAQAFLKNAQGAYKNINDQLDAQRATLEALDQGNAQGDRLAYINEAKIAAGSGGSRALGQILMQLHGDPSMASDTQKALNWIQNTPNLPTMQPAERDSLRETVFNRTSQLASQHQQAKAALAQQGPVIAPHADTSTLLQSITAPIDQKLADVQARQQQYQAARQKMAPQPPISQPAAANANPTTLDRLKSFFSGSSSQPPQPQQQAPAGPPVDEQAEFIKKFMAAKQAARRQVPSGQ